MQSIVTDINATGLSVRAKDGTVTRHEVGTVLWTAGVAAPSVATAIATATGAQQDRAGRIIVGEDLTIPDHPEIMVTGDVMSLNKLPGVCEVAMQTGIYAAERIKYEVAGRMATAPSERRCAWPKLASRWVSSLRARETLSKTPYRRAAPGSVLQR